MKTRVRHVLAACFAAAAFAPGFAAAASGFGPTPYLGFEDSPFFSGTFTYFHLENFEPVKPGETPRIGYSATTGGIALVPGVDTDSVDSDDSAIPDGHGSGGHSWFSNGTTSTFTFTFDAAVLGTLPTHVGIVWTDVGANPSGTLGFGDVTFKAFGPGSAVPILTIGPAPLGDGVVDGTTGEDRFFGATDAGGIASISISTAGSVDWEVDHLQYGSINAVPEPEQWLLLALGIGAVAWRVRAVRKLV